MVSCGSVSELCPYNTPKLPHKQEPNSMVNIRTNLFNAIEYKLRLDTFQSLFDSTLHRNVWLLFNNSLNNFLRCSLWKT